MVSDRKSLKAVLILGAALVGATFYLRGCQQGKQVTAEQAKRALQYENVQPVVVIGSGPAGLSAGLYCARANLPVLIIEGGLPGGQLTQTSYVENWPGYAKILGPDLIEKGKKQAAHFGAEFMTDEVETVDFTTWPFIIYTTEHKIHAMSVIIATGATPRTLGIPGEQEYWGRGVTTCAVCDAPFYKDKDVIVVGGGDSAAEEAMYLSSYARSVTVLVRSGRMRAASVMQERMKGYNNITIKYNTELVEIIGDDDEVTAARLYDTNTDQTTDVAIDGVFLAIGHMPNTKPFEGQLDMDDNGYLIVQGRSQQTSVPGIFAAGDVEDHTYRQAGVASGAGIKAALDAVEYLTNLGINETFLDELESRGAFFKGHLDEDEVDVMTVRSTKGFEQEVLQHKGLVFVDFYGTHCPSCMQMLPAIRSAAYRYADEAKFVKVDIGAASDLAKELHVASVPMMLVYRNGKLIGKNNKAMNRRKLASFVRKFIED